MEITWLGHAAFKIEHNGFVVLVDPWINNPKKPENLELDHVDAILITHAHFDHVGDAAEIAKKHNAKVYSIFEVSKILERQGVPQSLLVGMNKGGTVELGGGFKATMVEALHSSTIIDDDGNIIPGGEAAAFIVHSPDGNKIYHAGDTSVFGDMKIISDLYGPNIALLPIGGHYTMDPKEAAYALNNLLLSIKKIIPMHYGTFPVINGSPEELKQFLTREDIEVITINPGEKIEI